MNEQPRCETCKYWDEWHINRYISDEYSSKWAEDQPRRRDGAWGSCELIQHSGTHRGEDGVLRPRAYTMDGSDYWSGLTCRSDFGCVEHTPRDSEV